jgi:hypothetical protein
MTEPGTPGDRSDTPPRPTRRTPRATWDPAKVPPRTTGATSAAARPDLVVIPDDVPVTASPSQSAHVDRVIVLPDAPAPTAEVPSLAPVVERHAPPLVTRLVGLGLVGVGALLLLGAMNGDAHPAAPTKANSQPVAHVAVPAAPTSARILAGGYTGDTVWLTVTPTGSDTRSTLVVEPDATLALSGAVGTLTPSGVVPLASFLDTVRSQPSAVQRLHFRLSYDKAGAVKSIVETGGS